MKTFTAALVSGFLAQSALALCPGADLACSGNGVCGASDKCDCHRGYQGHDCSERSCAYRLAFADIKDATVTDRQPHHYAECSNAGVCDRETGQCECFEGYTGTGCERLTCPNNCNGNGQCVTMGRANSGYTGWDANKQMVCQCDPGFEGPDCSARMCPLGDDPLTTLDSTGVTLQVNEVQTITFAATTGAISAGEFTIKFTDQIDKVHETRVLDVTTATAITVKEALMSLPNFAIPSVTVSKTGTIAGGSVAFAVTFTDDANSGDVPDMVVDTTTCATNGCQPYKATALAGGGTTTATVAETTKGTKERAVCSNRGLCNAEDGRCECSAGYTGVACESQTVAT